ncbi:TonB-dependent receptor [Silanimonas lenta]|uniref:TonB-dependent receptor n=1 Tax=Silanimonas lenta TaxID=265429 RepID=UPI000413DDBB|nr:TonB-dependent receptor [Silanimonas lenta]
MPALRPALISAAVALALAASLTPAPSQAAEPRVAATRSAGTLTGTVKEGVSGQFLDGARISVAGIVTSSNREGRFRVAGLPAGRHTVEVDFVGYAPQRFEIEVDAGRGARAEVVLVSTTQILERVEVRASRDAQALALNQQRTTTNYTNVVSADLLGRFPDANVAEATQRIPGVAIERDQGEGRYVSVRGAPLEFTSVSVDGLPLSAPNPTRRAVELDTIPSDVIAAMEVTKALTPDMDGDAIAGNINIRTQSALDREGPTVRASIAGGRYQLGPGDNDAAKLTLGNRFGAERNLGLLISASGSRQGRFTENIETTFQRNTSTGQFLPTLTEIKDYDGTRTRTGFSGRFDARLDENHLVYAIASASKFRDKEYRNLFGITFEQPRPGATQAGGEFGRATFDKEIRERIQEQRIRTLNLGGEHYLGDWALTWQAGRSEGEFDIPSRQQVIYRSTLRPPLRYDYSNPDFPRYTLLNPDGSVRQEGINIAESTYAFRRYNRRFEQADESENSFRIDLLRDQEWLGDYGTVKFGLRSRLRDKVSNDDRFRNSVAAGTPAYAGLLCDTVSNNFGRYLFGREYCQSIFSDGTIEAFRNANLRPLVADSVVNDYRSSEDIHAAYLRLDAHWDRLTLVTGLRYERTSTEGFANRFAINTGQITPQAVERDYVKLLPSLHFRFEGDADTVYRWSYSTAVRRPNYPDTVPRLAIDDNARTATAGNPDLKATYSHNFDASVERYLRPLGLVSAAVFHKELRDPIFIASTTVGTGPDALRITQPLNGKDGHISGLELAWQQSFDWLPAPFDGFGLYTNYTYAESEAELPLGIGKTELPGTSRNNLNVALSYEKAGFNTRLSYTRRSKFIQEFDVDDDSLNVYWDARPVLDLSASYAIDGHWEVFAEANNLTDSLQRRFQGNRNRVFELEGFGRFWKLGLRYKL